MNGKLIGVGVGPGDPGNLTLNALAALENADRVFLPETESSRGSGEGRAERIVASHVAPERIGRLSFSMRDRDQRASRWEEAGEAIAAVVRAGETAAFATIGDPNVYSTFTYVAATVRELVPGVVVETVPGITAMQDLASRSGTVLAEGSETLTLIPYTAGADSRLREELGHDGTAVIYKSGARLGELLETVRELGRIEETVYGENVGLEEERIGTAADLDGSAPYMATVIVPARRDRRGGKL